jgi:hypothetical protein
MEATGGSLTSDMEAPRLAVVAKRAVWRAQANDGQEMQHV